MVTSDPLQGSNSVPRWSVFSQIHSTQSLMLVLSQKLSGCPRRSGRPDGGQAVPSTPSIPEPSGPHPGCSCRASGGGGGGNSEGPLLGPERCGGWREHRWSPLRTEAQWEGKKGWSFLLRPSDSASQGRKKILGHYPLHGHYHIDDTVGWGSLSAQDPPPSPAVR